MMAKIEWYQEVLTLEPGSKVFFPYARCLAEAGQREEALRVLGNGLNLHPEFLEARVFMVALLHEAGEKEACQAEVARVVSLFAAYPGFWDAWSFFAISPQSKKLPGLKDNLCESSISLAASLLAGAFRQQPVSVDALLALGLHNLHAVVEHKEANAPLKPVLTIEMPEAVDDVSMRNDSDGEDDADTEISSVCATPVFETSHGVATDTSALSNLDDQLDEELADWDEADENDEPVTIRTRSMADVLAEQGDVIEAVAIYKELVEVVTDPAERKKIRKRLTALEAQIRAESTQLGAAKSMKAEKADKSEKAGKSEKTTGQSTPVDEATSKGKSGGVTLATASAPAAPASGASTSTASTATTQGLRSVLENLADRLEARSRN